MCEFEAWRRNSNVSCLQVHIPPLAGVEGRIGHHKVGMEIAAKGGTRRFRIPITRHAARLIRVESIKGYQTRLIEAQE
jgi:hypothetical protein